MARQATDYSLVIGDKNYSSWSLRPWLAMRRLGVPFSEINVALRTPERRANIARHSPSGLVPVLKIGGRTVWDSLAIMETLAEAHPDLRWWPEDAAARAAARSVAAEMHSGFAALRRAMPMDFVAVTPAGSILDEVGDDIRRIVAIWTDCRGGRPAADGPFLFGAFSIADAMYAPVASRLRTYAVPLAAYGDDGAAAAYAEAVLAMPEMAQWREGAARELAERRGS